MVGYAEQLLSDCIAFHAQSAVLLFCRRVPVRHIYKCMCAELSGELTFCP